MLLIVCAAAVGIDKAENAVSLFMHRHSDRTAGIVCEIHLVYPPLSECICGWLPPARGVAQCMGRQMVAAAPAQIDVEYERVVREGR